MRRLLLVLASVAMLVVVLAGCGGSSESSEKSALESYLNGLRPALQTWVDANNSGAKAMTAMQSGGGGYQEFMTSWRLFIDGYRRAETELRAMNVPANLADAHAKWVDSIVTQADSAVRFEKRLTTYRAAGAASTQKQAELSQLFTEAQTDQMDVVRAMETWGTKLQDENNRLQVPAPSWWKDLMSQVQYRTTP